MNKRRSQVAIVRIAAPGGLDLFIADNYLLGEHSLLLHSLHILPNSVAGSITIGLSNSNSTPGNIPSGGSMANTFIVDASASGYIIDFKDNPITLLGPVQFATATGGFTILVHYS